MLHRARRVKVNLPSYPAPNSHLTQKPLCWFSKLVRVPYSKSPPVISNREQKKINFRKKEQETKATWVERRAGVPIGPTKSSQNRRPTVVRQGKGHLTIEIQYNITTKLNATATSLSFLLKRAFCFHLTQLHC